MKTFSKLLMISLSLAIGLALTSTSLKADRQTLLPKPKEINYCYCPPFSLERGIRLDLPNLGKTPLRIKEALTELITSNGGHIDPKSDVVISLGGLSFGIDGAEFQDEAYSFKVETNKIVISAPKVLGLFRAVQTLTQLAEGENKQVVACSVKDWSAWRVRGYMHDCGRSYLPIDKLKEQIIKLAYFKINVFHWHLTDNQGWRLQSKVYPQLNGASAYGRHPEKFYTIEEAKELVRLANQYGVTVIPEIDMPGHSEAFRKAMGHSMLTEEGLKEMKAIVAEASETFSETDWLHIGTDEVRRPDLGTMDWKEFVPKMTKFIHALGKNVMSWNPGYHHADGQVNMTQMWSSRGRPTTGIPAVDSRYHYINHYDQYADIVGLYHSNIAKQQKQSGQYAGAIIGIWNDRNVPSYDDIINQNAFYGSMLAIAERAWQGGGKAYFEQGGVMLDPKDHKDFADWERRFLFHKYHSLKSEPIAYVKQTNVNWLITDAFPNNGDTKKVFPPETSEKLTKSYTYDGKTYGTKEAVGAGIYLRHVWGESIIPAFYKKPKANATAYAFTYVYSPMEQEVAAQIGFQDYSRSEPDLAPRQGAWDYNDSQVWVNGKAIAPPVWQNTHTSKSQEITLKNENFCTRPVVPIHLNKGWNKVLIKLPNHGFRLGAVRLVKWMFTFVLTTADGKKALDNVVYDPEMKKSSEHNPSPVEVLEQAQSQIYPNPCGNTLFLKNVDRANIFALNGNLLQTLEDSPREVNISKLRKGTYLVQTFSGSRVKTHKLIKQ